MTKRKSNWDSPSLEGIVYLILFFTGIGTLIDIIIYYKTENKSVKQHAGQAIFLWLVTMSVYLIVFFAAVQANPVWFITWVSSTTGKLLASSIIPIFLLPALAAFVDKQFKIPLITNMFEFFRDGSWIKRIGGCLGTLFLLFMLSIASRIAFA